MSDWSRIESAPKDRPIIVYCPERHGLQAMASICQWHPEAGFCVDELREPTCWAEIPPPTVSTPKQKDAAWYPIVTAPRDGTPIQARIPGHGDDNIIAWQDGFLDAGDRDCGCWQFVEDQEPPECWTDGVCWEVNEDGERSVQPTHWKDTP